MPNIFTPPDGLALYLRRYSAADHVSPEKLMKKHKDSGAKWIAVAGPWDDSDGFKFINKPEVCKRLLDAAHNAGLTPYVWGYPWLGREEKFADAMNACAGEYNYGLLDPELGANPMRATHGAGKARANEGAKKLVELMAERFPGGVVGLSTFGSGVRLKWFPMEAYTQALAASFPGRTFVGGQTYTEDSAIDPSIADFLGAIEKVGGQRKVQLVPNFGTYDRVAGVVRAKTPGELDAHFMEFIDEQEPIHALIGWAENFMNPGLWRSFARMAERMRRGTTTL